MATPRDLITNALMRNESIVPGTEFAPQREGFAPMMTTSSWPVPTTGQRYFGAVDPMAVPAPDNPRASTSRLSAPSGGSWGDVEGPAPIPYGGRPLAPWMSPQEQAPGPPPDPFMRRPGFPGQQDMRLHMDEFSSSRNQGDTWEGPSETGATAPGVPSYGMRGFGAFDISPSNTGPGRYSGGPNVTGIPYEEPGFVPQGPTRNTPGDWRSFEPSAPAPLDLGPSPWDRFDDDEEYEMDEFTGQRRFGGDTLTSSDRAAEPFRYGNETVVDALRRN